MTDINQNLNEKETASVLNNILEYLHDSRDGYRECSEEVEDARLKNLFGEFAETRERMINTLQTQVLGSTTEEPEKSGSMAAAAHRIFIDLKSLVTKDPKAIIDEVRRGEDLTIERYKEALNHNLPSHVKLVLNQQLTEIESNLARIESYPSG